MVNLDLHSHCSLPIVNSKHRHLYGVSQKNVCLIVVNLLVDYFKKISILFYISNSRTCTILIQTLTK